MTKCSVGSMRNRSAGSNNVAADETGARPKSSALTSSATFSGRARNIFQECEIGNRRDVDAGEIAPRHRDVRLAPEADVGGFLGHDSLNLGIDRAPLRVVG